MWKWFNDHAVPVIGTILGVLGFYYGRFSKRQQVKHLGWRKVSDEHILTYAASQVGEGLVVTHNGRRVIEPRLLRVSIVNTGCQAVRHDDYRRPIQIELAGVGVVAFSVLEKSFDEPIVSGEVTVDAHGEVPEDNDRGLLRYFKTAVRGQSSTALWFVPEIMDAGDRFDVQIVVDGDMGDLNVHSRIVGETRPMRSFARLARRKERIQLLVFSFVVAMGGLAGMIAFGFSTNWKLVALTGLIIGVKPVLEECREINADAHALARSIKVERWRDL